MSIKKDIEDTLVLLILQEINSPHEETDELLNLIKEILLVLSSSRYLMLRNYFLAKSQYWWYEILSLYDDICFKKLLRMERQQFNKLIRILHNDPIFQSNGKKPQASYQKPRDINRTAVHVGFQAIGGFQNIIRAIDGTHFILNEAPA
ncbi:hypothetical protein C1645_815203 [Glomus cerebriforme]|uniref:Uncharacterized protein n=1 Tax=Glomus cerebriforme TaxID=658196 RepID=A0A397THX8_9GLOM|nr:hypothetical protein C1645_815203 [Glomus cerebriforme]